MSQVFGFVYVTENLVNGKRYIGQRKCRRRDDRTYIGSGSALRHAIAKYGRDSFFRTTLQRCGSAEDLNLAEIAWIAQEDAVSSSGYYNIDVGGKSGGHIPSDETRRRLSESHKGKVNSPETRAKISSGNKGKKVTAETKRKMSLAMTGKKHSAESIALMSAVKSGTIVCLETGQRFNSNADAARWAGVARPTLTNHLSLGRGKCGGYTFKREGNP